MNQTIRELFVKAGGVVEVCDVTNDEVLTYSENCDPEVFAKLIVAECMTICEQFGDMEMDGHYCADTIGKRFGV